MRRGELYAEALGLAGHEMAAWLIVVPVVVLIVILWVLWLPVGMVVDEVAALRRWRATRKAEGKI